MNINRQNCEAFFLDFYEGRLNMEQTSALFQFLENNADLRDLFDSFVDASFNEEFAEEEVIFPNKNLLKKSIETTDSISEKNIEWFCIASLEGLLHENQKHELEAFIRANPQHRQTFHLIQQTRLEVEPEIMFEGKSALKKSTAFVISAENFDAIAVQALEGELTAEQLLAFNNFLATHPEKQTEFSLFEQTRLVPENELVFPNKNALKKDTAGLIHEANFEEYAVAFLDQELKSNELAAFTQFLQNNPEKQAVIDAFRQTILQPEAVSFTAKESLKQTTLISADNFDEYAVAAFDGELNAIEQNVFDAYLKSNPEKQIEMTLLAQTRLQPDTNIVFPDKSALYHDERAGIAWWTVTRWSAAAAVLLLIGVFFFNSQNTNSGTGELANKDSLKSSPKNIPQVAPNQAPQAPQQIANNTVIAPDKTTKPELAGNPKNKNNKKPLPIIVPDNNTNTRFVAYLLPNKTVQPLLNKSTGLNQIREGVVEPYDPNANLAYQPNYISPGQYLARRLKKSLDGSSKSKNPTNDEDESVEEVMAMNADENKKVTGFDLASSAVNRVGQATGGKVSLTKEEDRRTFKFWKYSVSF
ncbi:MAG: hypothetical protein ACRCYO_06320 [Bacteroidia bacterium]